MSFDFGDSVSFIAEKTTRALFLLDNKQFCEKLREEMELVLQSTPRFFEYDLTEQRAIVEEESITLDDLSIDELGNGKAWYQFNESLHMGCRDISGITDHDGEFDFSYDLEDGSVTIPFRIKPERDDEI